MRTASGVWSRRSTAAERYVDEQGLGARTAFSMDSTSFGSAFVR